jgi:hypothetical protein
MRDRDMFRLRRKHADDKKDLNKHNASFDKAPVADIERKTETRHQSPGECRRPTKGGVSTPVTATLCSRGKHYQSRYGSARAGADPTSARTQACR